MTARDSRIYVIKRVTVGESVSIAPPPEQSVEGFHWLDDSDYSGHEVVERLSDTRVRLADERVIQMCGIGAVVDESRDEQRVCGIKPTIEEDDVA